MISPQGCSKWTGLGVFLDDSNEDLQMYSLGGRWISMYDGKLPIPREWRYYNDER